MKKVITLVMSSILILGASMTCLANTEVTSTPGTAQTEITRNVGSEYSVLIPKKIVIADSETTTTFSIQAKGNLSATQQIDVTLESETVDMNRKGDASYDDKDATLAFDNNAEALTWTEENCKADEYTAQSGTATFEETKAGEYSGNAVFEISLNDIATP